MLIICTRLINSALWDNLKVITIYCAGKQNSWRVVSFFCFRYTVLDFTVHAQLQLGHLATLSYVW
jgi:hypothetical protein